MVGVEDLVSSKVTVDSGCTCCVQRGVDTVGGQYSNALIVWEAAGICAIVPEPVENKIK